MSNSAKQCVGCNRCKQVFCNAHVQEYRHQLTNRLDELLQEHDLLREELNRSVDEHVLFEKINQWEKEAITKIQVQAEGTRADLRIVIENSKKGIIRSCSNLAMDIRSSREEDNFDENHLQQWTEQLNKLQTQLKALEFIELIDDQQSTIRTDILEQFQFSTLIQYNQVKDNDLLVVQADCIDGYSYILGRELYSNGQDIVYIRIKNISTPYNIFLGCFSPATIEQPISFRSKSVLGWFGYNEIWKHAIPDSDPINHEYRSDEILVNDVLCLTFNCMTQQVEFFHQRLNKRFILPVDLDQTPFPWQLLIILNENDSIEMFSSSSRR